MKIAFVLCAAKRFLSINIQSRKLARGRVLTVREAGISRRVYDLTVDRDHEFVAGGILVSNCIDAIRYAYEDEFRPRVISGAKVIRRGG